MVLRWKDSYDVVVAGGGPAGIMAAVAAARTGARTLLVELNGYVGGLAVVGVPLHGFYNNREESIIEGIPREFVNRMKQINGAADGRNTLDSGPRGRGGTKYNARWITYDPEAYKHVALEMLQEAGVELLVHTVCSDVILRGSSHVAGLVVENKSGRVALGASQVVDCTGDADLAARAGAPYEKGRPSDGTMQPMTPLFIMSGVDAQRASQAGALTQSGMEVIGSDFWERHNKAYSIHLEPWKDTVAREIPEFAQILTSFGAKDFGNGVWYCGNGLHIPGLDASDGDALSQAEVQARMLLWRLVQFLRRHVPGFENARLVTMLPRIGVRETRRILGEYYLTYDDVVGARQFDDVVTLCGYRVDIHGYDGGAEYHEPEEGTQVKDYGAYDIPYRCFVPRDVENLLVAGRPISASHVAHGSLRVMGTCMGMGHAAGVAAALSAREGVAPRHLSVRQLQEALLQQGAYLGKRLEA